MSAAAKRGRPMATDPWRVTDEQDGDWTVWAKMPSGQWQLITFADSESVATNIMETLSGSARLATAEAERAQLAGLFVRVCGAEVLALKTPAGAFLRCALLEVGLDRERLTRLAATQERTD